MDYSKMGMGNFFPSPTDATGMGNFANVKPSHPSQQQQFQHPQQHHQQQQQAHHHPQQQQHPQQGQSSLKQNQYGEDTDLSGAGNQGYKNQGYQSKGRDHNNTSPTPQSYYNNLQQAPFMGQSSGFTFAQQQQQQQQQQPHQGYPRQQSQQPQQGGYGGRY
jgi:hypothetical protein